MNKKIHKISVSDLMIEIILGIFALFALFPFYQTILLSFSKQGDIFSQTIYLYPVNFDLSAYKFLLEEGKVLGGFWVTLFVTIVGTAISMLVTTAAAYALSKKQLPGRGFFMGMIIFTMYFSGGLVPYFLTIKNLGLQNNLFSMILPVTVNTFNLILMKNFFNHLPAGLEEAAKIDGANDMYILVKIVLPISAPIIATVTLFYAVDRWNEWYNGMLFISDVKKYPLQLVLRNAITNASLLINNAVGATLAEKMGAAHSDSIKSAMIVISATPILLVYPKLQKYFANGIMLGSIKE
jgi:putative aldouronate transport system permease protein